MSWAFGITPGFVALYTRELDGVPEKYTLPVVGAVRALGPDPAAADQDPRYGTVLVLAPAASPASGEVVPASQAMNPDDGWKFEGIGYPEDTPPTTTTGGTDAGSDVATAGP